jgi:rhodanese-related sulfurtransferase
MSENEKSQIINSLTPLEAFNLIKEHADDGNWIVLDVRTPWEFSNEHIEGAENLDFTDPNFTEMLEKLDKEKNYIIYCKTGIRSGKVLEIIKELGFNKVYNINGGFEGWKSANL